MPLEAPGDSICTLRRFSGYDNLFGGFSRNDDLFRRFICEAEQRHRLLYHPFPCRSASSPYARQVQGPVTCCLPLASLSRLSLVTICVSPRRHAQAGVHIGSEAGSYWRVVDSCNTQRKAQGPCRTCNESNDETEEKSLRCRQPLTRLAVRRSRERQTIRVDSHYQSSLDDVYVHVAPWSEFPIVPSYPHHMRPRCRHPLAHLAVSASERYIYI